MTRRWSDFVHRPAAEAMRLANDSSRRPLAPLRRFLVVVVIVTCIGCELAGAGRPQAHDPATAASKAIEAYDRNGDGKLSADELKRSPALAASVRRIDRNEDGIITAEEIRARLEEIGSHSDYIALDVVVTYKNRPLAGAKVTLTPESFLGEGYPKFTGTTVDGGGCSLINEGRPLPGVPPGFYQASIVDASRGINVVQGFEISDEVTGNRLRMTL
jgi:EF hand